MKRVSFFNVNLKARRWEHLMKHDTNMSNPIWSILEGAQLMKERTALITGSAAGIGYACARLFSFQGARVILVDINEEGLKKVSNEIIAAGGYALPIKADLTDEKDIISLYRTALDKLGNFDILINNAGGGLPTDIFDITSEEWDWVVRLNLTSVFLMSQRAAQIFKEQGYGVIVNLSSIAGRSTSVTAGCHYTSAKAGILGLTRHLARQLASYNVRVNAVCPGVINSKRLVKRMEEKGTRQKIEQSLPLGRIGDVYEAASCCLFLASDLASYVTGESLDVNGGALMI